MAPVSNELFLLSCINNSNGGKIDFKQVAQEADMPSAGAASMRFRRFREKHDTSLLNTGDTKTTSGQDTPNAAAEDDEEQTPKSKKTPVKKTSAKKDSSKKTSAKKRKLSEAAEDEAVQSPIKGEPEEDEDGS